MYGKSPFGNPDGSRTEITDMMTDFIIFENKFSNSGVAHPDDMKTRVIVGAKGSGKTVYLRRMQANLKDNPSVYVSPIEQEVPSTDLIIRFSQAFSEAEVTEKWMYLWKFAIMRSLISHILTNEEWNKDVTDTDKKTLREYQDQKVFPRYTVPMTIYAEARNILSYYYTRNSFNEYSVKKEWDELSVIVGKILKNLPPIYFFIDSVDEEYAHAPMYWLRCQKGLFYRVMRLVREETYGNKLHVVIGIRDNVMASVCESEHHTRYINADQVRTLKWDYNTVKYFFERKIEKIDDCYFITEGEEKNISNWLGLEKLHNNHRHIDEPVIRYILRHTRLLPRDIVIVGNSLASIKRKLADEPSLNIEDFIRQKVSDCAKTFGNELLQICANQINNNEMPKGAGNREYSEVYTSIKEYNESTVHHMKRILSTVDTDKLSWNTIERLEQEAKKCIGQNCEMFNVLWQNGGIGYIENGPNERREIFFDQEMPEFLLPKGKNQYILRSCIIDAVGIENKHWDEYPVIGGNSI